MAILVDCPFSAESGFVEFNMGAEANGQVNVPVNDGRLVPVPGHIEIAQAPDGSYAYQATIYPDDEITRLAVRSEISHGRESVHANGGAAERWYRLEVYIPSSSIGPDPLTIIQIHDTPDAGESPVKFMNFILRMRDGNFDVLVPLDAPSEATSQNRAPPGRNMPVPRDRWFNLALHANWSKGSDGYLEFYLDNTLMAREWCRPCGYNDVVGPYWKVGMYDLNHAGINLAKPYRAWYRNAKVYSEGHTAEEVLGAVPRIAPALLVSQVVP